MDKSSNKLVLPDGDSGSLTTRSSILVRRGLATLELLRVITPEMLGRLCSDLTNDNFDVRAAAAISISSLRGVLTLEKEGAEQVLFSLVDNLHSFFEGRTYQPHLFWHGDEYYPPGESYKKVLLQALESLVGPVSNAADAVIYGLTHGDRDTQIRAAVWLGHHVQDSKAIALLESKVTGAADELVKVAAGYALGQGQYWITPSFIRLIEYAEPPKQQNIELICKRFGMNFTPTILSELHDFSPTVLSNTFYNETESFTEETVNMLLEHITLDEDDLDSYIQLGEIYRYIGRYQSALAVYQHVVKLDPESPDGYYGLGMAYLELEDISAASSALERLEELDLTEADETLPLVLSKYIQEFRQN